ncbi:MAG: maleylacetoacetate isomerase, partial [Woeseiaceae bacterium]
RSSAAYRVRIALNLKGLDYNSVPINLAPSVSEQRSDDYLKRNPQGRVPFFEDGQVAIGQSMAILEYLEETHPAPALLPDAAGARARIRSFCNSIACDVHPLNNVRVMVYLKDELDASDSAYLDWYAHWIHLGFQAAETFVSYAPNSRYVYGNEVTLADCFLVPQMYNARRFDVPLDDFPRLVEIVDNCNELDAFRRAIPEKQADATL